MVGIRYKYLMALLRTSERFHFLVDFPTGKDESIDTDMPLDMQNFILALCVDATKRYKVEREIALHIKQKLQERYPGHWNCIVGMRFGSDIPPREFTQPTTTTVSLTPCYLVYSNGWHGKKYF
ncbi:unnamed protein product [Echinostoma caproni]|uniref:Dynein light chain n=1 Tax=Echinostoma caproni TaxID=27848 RepID=A0A183ADA3_9TREM|nr:unnamed protein product [Echinostoma caproni]